MYWNYRLVVMNSGKWVIRQIVYEDGEMTGYYPRPTPPVGEDRDELLESLDQFMRASFTHHLSEDELEDLHQFPDRPSGHLPWKEA